MTSHSKLYDTQILAFEMTFETMLQVLIKTKSYVSFLTYRELFIEHGISECDAFSNDAAISFYYETNCSITGNITDFADNDASYTFSFEVDNQGVASKWNIINKYDSLFYKEGLKEESILSAFFLPSQ